MRLKPLTDLDRKITRAKRGEVLKQYVRDATREALVRTGVHRPDENDPREMEWKEEGPVRVNELDAFVNAIRAYEDLNRETK